MLIYEIRWSWKTMFLPCISSKRVFRWKKKEWGDITSKCLWILCLWIYRNIQFLLQFLRPLLFPSYRSATSSCIIPFAFAEPSLSDPTYYYSKFTLCFSFSFHLPHCLSLSLPHAHTHTCTYIHTLNVSLAVPYICLNLSEECFFSISHSFIITKQLKPRRL